MITPGLTYGITLGRSGSKGLPGKNLRALGGHPLIAWSVAAGMIARSVDRVLCSTDDVAIASAAEAAGAEVPFLRPAELASDFATDLDVFAHALHWLAENEGRLPEFVVQLRPTTPFREARWIDQCLARMEHDQTITCIRSIAIAPQSPYKMWIADESLSLAPFVRVPGVVESFNLPRQQLPEVWWHTGQLDIIRTEVILGGSMTGQNIKGFIVPIDSAIDIDTMFDFKLAELMYGELMPSDLVRYLFEGAR